jgi:hypothetical protein
MLWVPAASAEVEKFATPLLFKSEVLSNVVASMKFTVPLGMPVVVEVTVAVRVTVWFRVEGFGEEPSDVFDPAL